LRRTALVLAGLSCLLALAACGPKATAGGSGDGPPKGGWPQAQNGQLGENMCDLLVPADYKKVGLTAPIEDDRKSDAANSVFCSYLLGNKVNLYLQPTAEAAKAVYANHRNSTRRYLKSDGFTSEEVTGAVPGADDSSVDLDPLSTDKYKAYVAYARRGALLVEVGMQPDPDKAPADPKQAVATLAGLILTRVPGLGGEDTGRTHTITYTVTGKGTADVNYAPFTSEGEVGVSVTKATLPWKVEIPFGLTSTDESLPLSITANTNSRDFTGQVNCTIAIDGKVIKQGTAGMLTFCTAEYKLTD
jgi:hypothetical protein